MTGRDFSSELFGSGKAFSFDDALRAEGVNGRLADVARSIYQQESGSGANTKTSYAGAVGHMQIIPATFSRVADKDWNIQNPEHNMRAGLRYLKQLDALAGGDPRLVAAGYYGGEGAIPKARQGVAVGDPINPRAPNTLQYADQVASRLPAQTASSPGRDFSAELFGGEEATPEPTVAERAKRATGLGARAVGPVAAGAALGAAVGAPFAGVGAVPGAMAGAGAMGLTQLIDNLTGMRNIDKIMDRIGLPRPGNATERITQDVLGGMAGGAGGVATGSILAQSSGPVLSRIGQLLQSQPGLQVAAGATGGASAGAAREAGGGPLAQIGAGLAGATAPALVASAVPSAVKSLFRGGEQGRQTVAGNIKLFEDAGYGTPTAGQASESRFTRALESGLSRSPGGAGTMARAAERGAENLGASVTGIADDLSRGANSVTAGATIEKGVKSFVDRFRAEQKFLYDKLDNHIPSDTPVNAFKTIAALKEINSEIPGAARISSQFSIPRLKSIEADLRGDVLSSSGGKLPYEALKELRTKVGREIENNSLVSDVPRAAWKQLYAALSDDMGIAASKAGPEAERAFARANTYTRAGHDRIATYLDRVAGKDTVERVFQAAVAPGEIREGASTINAVMRSLKPDERDVVKAAFIKRLGNAQASAQDAAGDVFSTQTFLTNWNKISPQAKMTLFSGNDGELVKNLNKIASVASNIRDGSKVFANPSGTAGASANTAAGVGVLVSAVMGNFGGVAAIGGTALSANQAAKLMTNPDFVRWLAKSTTAPSSAIPSALNELSQLAKGMKPEERGAVNSYMESVKEKTLR